MTNEQIVQQLQYLIGSRYVPSVKTYISELTGRPRVLGPNEASTLELDANRIAVGVDAAGRIAAFSFG
jgi:hypothetical protein